jgi:DNA-binding transcriptional ArsR family regulator
MSDEKKFDDRMITNIETILKMMANAQRLVMLCKLLPGKKSVSELVDATGLSQSSVSQHLSKMRAHDIVTTKREGQTIFYFIDRQDIRDILNTLCRLYQPK